MISDGVTTITTTFVPQIRPLMTIVRTYKTYLLTYLFCSCYESLASFSELLNVGLDPPALH